MGQILDLTKFEKWFFLPKIALILYGLLQIALVAKERMKEPISIATDNWLGKLCY